MRVFLTGGTGYIGSHLVRELLSHGDEVTVLTRDPLSAAHLPREGVALLQGDLSGLPDLSELMAGHDACIHNALWWGDEAGERELMDARVSLQVFESAVEAGVRALVYTSSTAVHRPFRPNMDENQRLTPTDLYGATKAAGEALLASATYGRGIATSIVRPGPTVGPSAYPGAPFRSDRRLEAIVQAARGGELIEVDRSDGRQFIGAADLARVYATILRGGTDVAGTYIAVAENLTTWEEAAERAIAITGSKSDLEVREGGLCHKFHTDQMRTRLGLAFNSDESLHAHLEVLAALL